MATPSFFVTDGNPRHPAQIIGYLAEKDNLNERFIFHWNPTSFRFKKTTEWTSLATKNYFIESLTFYGSKGLECTFELFLNEWDQHRAIQRPVEGAIGWLINRMGPVQKGAPRGNNWLDAAARAVQNHANQTADPPVLVFVGLRDVFTCVLTDVDITSAIQRPNVTPRSGSKTSGPGQRIAGQDRTATAQALEKAATTGYKIQQAALRRTAGGGTQPFNRNYAARMSPKPGDIVRATVQVTLKEFVPAQI